VLVDADHILAPGVADERCSTIPPNGNNLELAQPSAPGNDVPQTVHVFVDRTILVHVGHVFLEDTIDAAVAMTPPPLCGICWNKYVQKQ
jgi:hypothetical protein